MGRYRKKPVEIEARRFLSAAHREHDTISDYLAASAALADWCGGVNYASLDDGFGHAGFVDGPHIAIHTLEGVMCAEPGDWIVRGVQGEFYPVRNDIFEETYEPVRALPDPPDA
jgi:hypothetical protein